MRGFWFTLEATLAVIVLVVFLIALGSTLTLRQDSGTVDIAASGLRELRRLDDTGLLRDEVIGITDANAAGRLAGIAELISIPGYSHQVRICNHEENCWGEIPDAGNIFVADYLVTGAGEETLEIAEVILYIYR